MNRRRWIATGLVAVTAAAVTIVAIRDDEPRVLLRKYCPSNLVTIDLSLGLCTHGDDPAEAAGGCLAGLPCILPTPSPTPQPQPACFDDGQSGRRVHVFYAYTTTSEYSRWVSLIRGVAGDADRYLAAAGSKHFRWLCDSGVLRVTPIKVASNSLTDFIVAARAAGHQRTDRIYTAVHTVGGGGTGTIKNDDTPVATTNRNNIGPAYSIIRDFSAHTMLHELGHNIGAVQLSASHSTGAWHCTDERDVMCYDDGGPRSTMSTPCPSTTVNQWDCRDDDYWRPAGPLIRPNGTAGWNSFNSLFLVAL